MAQITNKVSAKGKSATEWTVLLPSESGEQFSSRSFRFPLSSPRKKYTPAYQTIVPSIDDAPELCNALKKPTPKYTVTTLPSLAKLDTAGKERTG